MQAVPLMGSRTGLPLSPSSWKDGAQAGSRVEKEEGVSPCCRHLPSQPTATSAEHHLLQAPAVGGSKSRQDFKEVECLAVEPPLPSSTQAKFCLTLRTTYCWLMVLAKWYFHPTRVGKTEAPRGLVTCPGLTGSEPKSIRLQSCMLQMTKETA